MWPLNLPKSDYAASQHIYSPIPNLTEWGVAVKTQLIRLTVTETSHWL
jgi:hypothetical protein